MYLDISLKINNDIGVIKRIRYNEEPNELKYQFGNPRLFLRILY